MSSLAKAFAPRSDQINADDMIGNDMVIKITAVTIREGSEQPVSISFEGSNKVYRPGKTVGRIMMGAWGDQDIDWIGKSLHLFREPSVKFGPDTVGGIRLRAMSHIERAITIPVTVSRGKRQPFTIQPLRLAEMEAREEAAKGTEAFKAWWAANPSKRDEVKPHLSAIKTICAEADAKAAPKTDDDLDVFGLPPIDPEAEARAFADQQAREAGVME